MQINMGQVSVNNGMITRNEVRALVLAEIGTTLSRGEIGRGTEAVCNAFEKAAANRHNNPKYGGCTDTVYWEFVASANLDTGNFLLRRITRSSEPVHGMV